MSPKEARIFLAEDNLFDFNKARRSLENAGHSVVVQAKTLEQALDLIPSLPIKKVNVAVLDANLSEGECSGHDGINLAKAIRTKVPGVKIVAYSAGFVPYGDVSVSKIDFAQGVVDLGKVVTEL